MDNKQHPIIIGIQTTIVDLPTIRPHQLSMATMQIQSMVIIQLKCSDDIIGLGEATTIAGLSYGAESPEGMKLVIDQYITPLIKGQNASNIRLLMSHLEKHIKGNYFAKAGIETALLDAQGKRLGIPVSALLGGEIRKELPVLWTLASGNTARDIEEAQQLVYEKRHKAFKLKIGKNLPKVDIAHACAIKEAVGPDIMITVDVNQAWSEAEAKSNILKLQEVGIDLIEQPIHKDNWAGLARLTAFFHTPIMADEAVSIESDAFALAQQHAASVFALKVAKAGGLYGLLRVAAIAESAGIALYGGTMLEGTIGTAASAHVMRCLKSLQCGTELFGPLLLTDDIVVNPIQYKNAALHLPEGPGLGLELDFDKIEKYKRK
ncbi:muconate/chloromuconate family cycloisomerase [Chondrinema litorale]|uniref:muconate/chloromuconate family cycloisomerase n=1 Tax=Chondrinema litorale TaxID=2994555 RepID=UPI002542F76F|nr:muconate/chloromuconate family cycloisomerase [Chondrinema litorale]UZR96939.1 muconate/chloromuconate family cycloisomerase [Chondrinema litorale]